MAEERSFLGQELGEDSAISEQDVALIGVINALDNGESAEIAVFRAEKKQGGMGAFLFRCEPVDFSVPALMEKLRDEYGGGEFRVRVTEATTQRLRANRLIRVETPKQSANNAQAVAPVAGDLVSLLASIQDGNRQQAETMREMMFTQQSENQRMILEIVKATATSAKSEAPTMGEIVQTLVALKELDGSKKSESVGSEKLIEMFFKGMDQGKELAGAGGGENESILSQAIKAFGPSIGEITQALNKANQAQAPQQFQHSPHAAPVANLPRRMVPPALGEENNQNAIVPPVAVRQQDDATALVAESGQKNEGDNVQQLLNQFAPYMQMLCVAAAQDADPEVYANMVLDQIAPEMVEEWIASAEKFDILCSYLPPGIRSQKQDWFDYLRDAVLALREDDQIGANDVSPGSEKKTVPDNSGSESTSDSDSANAG